MSRSYKKYAVSTCTTSASEKNDKRIAHRVFKFVRQSPPKSLIFIFGTR